MLLDIRYGLRRLRKNPGFTAVAVATLAFGIGLNTTLFSVVNAVALKPIPVPDGESVVRLERWFASGRHGNVQYAFSTAEFQSFRDANTEFTSLVATSFPRAVAVSLPTGGSGASFGPSENAEVQIVSANYFDDLRGRLVAGRGFRADEGAMPSASPVAVLSYPYWQKRWNGDPAIVGKLFKVNDTVFTIVGVASREFVGTGNPPVIPSFWAPLPMQAQIVPAEDWFNRPLDYELQVLGRLAPGTGIRRAQAAVDLIEQRFGRDHPDTPDKTTAVTLQRAALFGNTEDPRFKAIVALLMTIVGMVLIIACANLANMLQANALTRSRDFAVRLAIGASRARLLRQLVTESVMLAGLGGCAGLLASLWGTRFVWLAVGQFAGPHSAFVSDVGPDVRVFIYTALVALCTGLLFGLSPALTTLRSDLTSALKDAGTPFGVRLGRSRLRTVLVGGQVAISTLFLITAGLLARGVIRSQSADPGFQPRTLYAMGLRRLDDPSKTIALRLREVDALQRLPEIQDLAIVDHVPLISTWTTPVEAVESDSAAAPTESLARHVSSSFFRTMRIPIVRGRPFTEDEAHRGAAVAIVSEATARAAWPTADPLGKHVKVLVRRGQPKEDFEVVGVAGDVRTGSLSRIDPAMIYLPTNSASIGDYAAVLLRIDGRPRAAFAGIQRILEHLDGRPYPAFSLPSMEDDAVRSQRLMAQTFSLSAGFLAILALCLAVIGVYGVVSFLVRQREREVGIRMALGATSADVLRLMMRDGMRPVSIGAAVGFLAALGVSGFMRWLLVIPGAIDILYGAHWFDPPTFIGLSGLLLFIAALACYIPAREATAVDPMATLRKE